ncbi:MAG: HAMP domain-containing protein [Clostridia bacterium]|nr:HAMP domain-containing protein [Clostridia bacterium]
MKLSNNIKKVKESLESVRIKLFITLSITVVLIILFLIIVNNFVLETYYLYNKQKSLKSVYEQINMLYANQVAEPNIESELEKISITQNFDISIMNSNFENIYSSGKDYFSSMDGNKPMNKINLDYGEIIEQNDKFIIKKLKDHKNGLSYILLAGQLDNGYFLYLRIPITVIQNSVSISNNFLYLIAGFTILIGGILIIVISRKFTDPILELNDIAKKMAKLDFSKKYRVNDEHDEINTLGQSINIMSEKLEKTIKQLRDTNMELEKDIEEKSKIDEMRKKFISDVSHELKTPIALIQGYSEGLIENVNNDEESRKFYAEVILDEINKMDKLVKQLLELMTLEYGKREFNNKEFDIVELENEVIKRSKLMLDEKNIKIKFKEKRKINVLADDFYIEQVITNYLTNAIKNIKEVDNKRYIEIINDIDLEKNIVKVRVFNTGDNIKEEDMLRIWNRFYKADESRHREDGGTGIGLSFVKAIMNNYKKDYGVYNKENGVEFYFDLELIKK